LEFSHVKQKTNGEWEDDTIDVWDMDSTGYRIPPNDQGIPPDMGGYLIDGSLGFTIRFQNHGADSSYWKENYWTTPVSSSSPNKYFYTKG
jgi:hypothetical protein